MILGWSVKFQRNYSGSVVNVFYTDVQFASYKTGQACAGLFLHVPDRSFQSLVSLQ
jgi:hypothetical protein